MLHRTHEAEAERYERDQVQPARDDRRARVVVGVEHRDDRSHGSDRPNAGRLPDERAGRFLNRRRIVTSASEKDRDRRLGQHHEGDPRGDRNEERKAKGVAEETLGFFLVAVSHGVAQRWKSGGCDCQGEHALRDLGEPLAVVEIADAAGGEERRK